MTSLVGHRALVTGAARGIGRAVALRLAGDGAHVLAVDIDPVGLDDTARAARAGTIDVLAADVQDISRIGAWLDDQSSPPDILVNNAAIAPRTPLDDLDASTLAGIIGVNLVAPVMLAKEVAARLIRSMQSGVIVNVASVNAYRGHPDLLPYNASKAALLSATRTLASTWARSRIRVNAVCPGSTATPIWEEGGFAEQDQLDYAASNPMGRFARPGEIANVVAFLVTDESSFITGADVIVDGGLMVGVG